METKAKKPEVAVNPVAAVFAATLVTIVVSASYPFMTLKLGLTPGMAVPGALLGFMFMKVIGRMKTYDRHLNNCVQTSATAGASVAFMVVVIVALEWLGFNLTSFQTFVWLLVAGELGILLAVPFRKKFVEIDQLKFADGAAVAAVLEVLDSEGPESRKMTKVLSWSGVIAVVFTFTRDIFPKWAVHPDFGAGTSIVSGWPGKLRMGMNWSLMNIGVGMLIGVQVCVWMLVGSVVGWLLFVPWLHKHGMVSAFDYKHALQFTMWPATGLLVSAALTALLLEWRLLVKTFREMWDGVSTAANEMPLKHAAVGVVLLTVVLAVVQYWILHLNPVHTVLAVVFSVPLALVAIRVTGETNIGPVSPMGNMMQVVFAVIAPGNMVANMCSSGMTGSVVSTATDIQQDFKTGYLIGTSPKRLTYYEMYGVLIGAACTAVFYPILKAAYGIGEGGQLSAPTAMKWKGFAELLNKGFDALPPGCLTAFVLSVIVGILLTVLQRKYKFLSGAAMGIGIAWLVPGFVIVSMALGGFVLLACKLVAPDWTKKYAEVLASGFIAGEGILAAIVIPLLMVVGWLK